nr:ORF6C domain-containing protein [Rodentibacter genomosp. 1]
MQVAHHRTGLNYAEIYTQLKNQFQIAKYDQLPRSQLSEAIDFLNHVKSDNPTPVAGKIDWLNLYSLVTFLHKWAMFTQDLPHIYHHLKRHQESEALAEIINNHFSNIRENSRLFDNSVLALGEITQHCSLPPEQKGLLLNLLQALLEPKQSKQINPIFALNPF